MCKSSHQNNHILMIQRLGVNYVICRRWSKDNFKPVYQNVHKSKIVWFKTCLKKLVFNFFFKKIIKVLTTLMLVSFLI